MCKEGAKSSAFPQNVIEVVPFFPLFAGFLACSFLFLLFSPGEDKIGNGTERRYKVRRYSICPESSPTTFSLGYY